MTANNDSATPAGQSTADRVPVMDIGSRDWLGDVRPTGWLGDVLDRVGNPRRHRWQKYLRCCKAIPKESPVAGSTSFRVLNDRRHMLIDRASRTDSYDALDCNPEYRALQKATSAWLCGPMVVSTFLMQRKYNRLLRVLPNTKLRNDHYEH